VLVDFRAVILFLAIPEIAEQGPFLATRRGLGRAPIVTEHQMSTAFSSACDRGIAAAARLQENRYPRATLAATILGSSLAFIDGSVVNVALDALGRDLAASASALSWTVNAYLLPLGALILLGGSAGDHFGRRRLFLIGLIVFTFASILCAAAPSLSWFLMGRGLQGIGAALLMPNSLAMLGASFSGEARGRAIGMWAAVGALSGALAPLIGGYLVDTGGWRTIFLLNLPVAAAAGFLAWKFVPESKETQEPGSLDWAGAVLATLALGCLTWALTAASESAASFATLWMVALVGAAVLAAFVWIEAKRGERAIMPLALFATPTFVGLTLLTFFLYASLSGLLVLLPYLLINVSNYTAVAAGAAMLPLPLLIGVLSPMMGRVTASLGGRLPLAIGSAIVAAGFVLFMRVGADAVSYWLIILPATAIVAIGMGISVAPLTSTVMASVNRDHVGTASGFNSAVARIGGLIATALLGFVFAQQDNADGFVSSFRIAALIGAACAAAAACCALLLIRPPPTKPAAA
jgi:EmrB/QacA subfamily drug resistance transporter